MRANLILVLLAECLVGQEPENSNCSNCYSCTCSLDINIALLVRSAALVHEGGEAISLLALSEDLATLFTDLVHHLLDGLLLKVTIHQGLLQDFQVGIVVGIGEAQLTMELVHGRASVGWATSNMCNESGQHAGLLGLVQLIKSFGSADVFAKTGNEGAAGIKNGPLTPNLLVQTGSGLARSAFGAVNHTYN